MSPTRPARGTGRKTATRRATAKKTTGKRAAAGATTAKKAATKKKPTAKKPTARKATAKKAATRKVAAKRPAARKTAAKKVATKKVAAKKVAAKKATANSTARQAAGRKTAPASSAATPRRQPVRARTALDGAATLPSPKRTGSFKPRPDQTATPVEDAAGTPMAAEPKGPAQELSTKTHIPLERELPGPQASQVQQANPQRNLVRRLPR